MSNSEQLKFDYLQPISQLPYDLYVVYATDADYSHHEIYTCDKKKCHKIPDVIDSLFYPENVSYTVKGYISALNMDEILDFGFVQQERKKKVKRK